MSLIGLLVFLIIIGLLFWVIKTLGGAFGIPAPIIQVLVVVLVVIAVLYLLQALLGFGSGPILRLR